ncbi:MAG: hypothetical protein DSM107014_05395 [Gomphosphaeria aponina SAG 52.96 = DSM 107014]|uniref:Uncharacterized protein n=1 Tax=Gomphosphaeria aponina SAG 52.96 = DSM 107014 TaxID=1521640 RepID=A0A941GW02_9CHRO|nr:hypothetical protein [Gomphosphaeria aponina SAG 52.96 = DSM 107014]
MKWFFTLTDLSPSFLQDVKLAQVAVHTAKQNTSLEPVCLYDGTENEITEWLQGQGVTVISRRTPHYDKLQTIGERELQIGAGAFLSAEIPQIAEEMAWAQSPVLYTDVAVLFLKDMVEELQEIKCDYFAVARGEFNPGVMLINVANMQLVYQDINKYIGEKIAELVRQGYVAGAYKNYFAGEWQELPLSLNWRSYWEVNPEAKIVHFHGVRPNNIAGIITQLQLGKLPDVLVDKVNYHYLKHGEIWLNCYQEIGGLEETDELEEKLFYVRQQLAKGAVDVKRVVLLNQDPEASLWEAALDSPQPGAKLSADAVVVSGWVLGKQSPARSVELLLGDEVIATTEVNIPRPDVAQVYPSVSGAENSGFYTTVELGAKVELIMRVVLEDGSRGILGRVECGFMGEEGLDEPSRSPEIGEFGKVEIYNSGPVFGWGTLTSDKELIRITNVVKVSEKQEELLLGFSLDHPKLYQISKAEGIEIGGWVLGKNSPILRLELITQGKMFDECYLTVQRLDVAKLYPQKSEAKNCGFATIINLGELLETGYFMLQAVCADETRIPLAEIQWEKVLSRFDWGELELAKSRAFLTRINNLVL